MGGLLSSTVLTLVVLPYINSGLEDFAAWVRRVGTASRPARATGASTAGV
jgi:hypothetical protein